MRLRKGPIQEDGSLLTLVSASMIVGMGMVCLPHSEPWLQHRNRSFQVFHPAPLGKERAPRAASSHVQTPRGRLSAEPRLQGWKFGTKQPTMSLAAPWELGDMCVPGFDAPAGV